MKRVQPNTVIIINNEVGWSPIPRVYTLMGLQQSTGTLLIKAWVGYH